MRHLLDSTHRLGAVRSCQAVCGKVQALESRAH